MPFVAKNIEHYTVNYIGGSALQGKMAGANIQCYNAAGRVGGISFFADNLIFQPNQVLPDGTLSLTYEMSRFDDVINTLRYEKPLILAVNPDTGFGYLGNAELEPVGEQEAASAMIPVLA
jgi:hypothetical protein